MRFFSFEFDRQSQILRMENNNIIILTEMEPDQNYCANDSVRFTPSFQPCSGRHVNAGVVSGY